MKTFNPAQAVSQALRAHLVSRVLDSARSSSRELTDRETEVLSGIIDRNSDRSLALVSSYVSEVLRSRLVEAMETPFGELSPDEWDMNLSRWEMIQLEELRRRRAPSPIDLRSYEDDSDRTPLGPDALIEVHHQDQLIVLTPIDEGTGEPVDDYVSGDCGFFKIVQESGAHVEEDFARIFRSDRGTEEPVDIEVEFEELKKPFWKRVWSKR